MSVTIRFFGAARTVTGSCYLFETGSGRFLVDCGLFQGPKTLKELNYRPFPFRAADIDAVLLTHAHIDHSGLLPKLVRNGFPGRILATRGTIDLCSYMLPDAGSIQESEVAALNRRNAARGRAEVSPIYTQADAIATLQSFTPVDYEKWVDVIPGVRARYWNAGHLLGSASIEIEFADQDASRKAAPRSLFRRHRPRRQAAAARSRGAGGLRLRHLGIDLWRPRAAADHGRCATRALVGRGSRRGKPQGRPADSGLRGGAHPGIDRRSG